MPRERKGPSGRQPSPRKRPKASAASPSKRARPPRAGEGRRGSARKSKGRRKGKGRSGAGRWEWRNHPLVRLGVVAVLFAVFASLALVAMLLLNFDRKAARYDLATVGQLPMESVVLDAAGRPLGYLHREHVGTPVPLEEISPLFIDALIAREDSRFYRHHGIDRVGLVRAWLRNLREKRTVQGGSTITMQLTRMTYGLSERTLRRKLLEMALARRIEKHYDKEEILSLYVNRVFLGTGMNGIEQAAQGYFGKSAGELSLPEAAMIAGVIRAPNGFSPFRHYETACREMRGTLRRMADEGSLSKADLAEALEARPEVQPQERWLAMLREKGKVPAQGYLLAMVEEEVAGRLPSYAGVGGLLIRTSFDALLQEEAERAASRHLAAIEARPGYPHPAFARHTGGEPAYVQASVAVVENFTGAVRALVGGRDFSHSAYNRASRGRRPMGSVFKPFVYGTAFERGLFPGVLVSDAAIAEGEIPWDVRNWSPENADGVFGGDLPAALGLIQSRNTMTTRVGEWAGIDAVLAMMEHAGLGRQESERSPTVYIGTTDASAREVASAYSVFATGGVRHHPHILLSVADRDGVERYRHRGESYEVLSPGAAWLSASLLKGAVEEGGTGASLRDEGFAAPAGGKTGTTNAFHDAWFAGFTSRLSACVWIGLDRPTTIFEGAYGSRIALPLWREIMAAAEGNGYEFTAFAEPEEVIEMQLCRITGLLAGPACEAEDTVYVESVPHDLIPRSFCRSHPGGRKRE